MTLPRSAADALARHVVLELECIDRVYCNLYVPKLQRDLGVVGFIREHLGKPVASTAVLAERTGAFYAEIREFAGKNAIPLVEFRPGQRKDEVMRERLAQFLAEGRTEGVVFIGRAQEKVSVWATTRRRDAEGRSYPWIVRESRVVTQWCFYCHDACAGPFFIKYCGYFPYNAKLCCNGNEYAKAMAARAGIGFTPLDNGFAAVETPPRSRRSATASTRPSSGTWPPSGPGSCRARSPLRTPRPATGTRPRCCRRSSP